MRYTRFLRFMWKPLFFVALIDAATAVGSYLFDEWGWQHGGSGFVGLFCALIGAVVGTVQAGALIIFSLRRDMK